MLACGMWTRQLARGCGVSVPLHPVEHHYLLSNPTGDDLDDAPVTRDLDGSIYFRGERDTILIGAFQAESKPWLVDEVPADFAFSLARPRLGALRGAARGGLRAAADPPRDRLREVRQRPGELHAGRQPADGRDAGAGAPVRAGGLQLVRPRVRRRGGRGARAVDRRRRAAVRPVARRHPPFRTMARQPRVPARPQRRDARHALPAGGARTSSSSMAATSAGRRSTTAWPRTAPGSGRRWARSGRTGSPAPGNGQRSSTVSAARIGSRTTSASTRPRARRSPSSTRARSASCSSAAPMPSRCCSTCARTMSTSRLTASSTPRC